jgi:hypothetical protein
MRQSETVSLVQLSHETLVCQLTVSAPAVNKDIAEHLATKVSSGVKLSGSSSSDNSDGWYLPFVI